MGKPIESRNIYHILSYLLKGMMIHTVNMSEDDNIERTRAMHQLSCSTCLIIVDTGPLGGQFPFEFHKLKNA